MSKLPELKSAAILSSVSGVVILAARYLIIILMAIYTVQCYGAFGKKDEQSRRYLFIRQNLSMFIIHFAAFLILFLEEVNLQIVVFYAAQAVFLLLCLLLWCMLYPDVSRLLINNMVMLIAIGMIMLTRLSFASAQKQFFILVAGMAVALAIPAAVRRINLLTRMTWFYIVAGIGLLALVVAAARVTNGAKLTLSVGGIAFQPSEFVKIIFVFAVAGLLSRQNDFRHILTATVLAAVHVLLLVVSRDLGSALIFFTAYLAMLFAATYNPYLILLGLGAGSAASVAAYFIFSHVRTRVQIWKDPFADYAGSGYQISQSLFAVAAGGWFGRGLGQGTPGMIPYVQQDMMFSAIAEELGGIFAVCLIFVCLNCLIVFLNTAMRLRDRFYRLVVLGLAAVYTTQIFLTIGGGLKIIPLTGVTLPFISYGGSSALCTLAMFAIVQGAGMRRETDNAGE